MNIVLWIIQVLLALHTLAGALWKFSNPAQSVPSLEAIPASVWFSMSILELICSLFFVIPAFSKRLGMLPPIAATFITIEMVVFCCVHLYSGKGTAGQLIYWLVVAAFCIFIAWGRFVLKPIVPKINSVAQ